MMDKNHLPFGGRGRAKPVFLRPAPNCGALALHQPAPFPKAVYNFSTPQHIPLPALQLSSDTPAARILLTSQTLHNLPMRLFLLLLHLSDAPSALGKLNCEEMTMPWSCKPSEIHMQTLPAPAGTFTYLLHFSCSSWFQVRCFPSAWFLAHILLDAAMCHRW